MARVLYSENVTSDRIALVIVMVRKNRETLTLSFLSSICGIASRQKRSETERINCPPLRISDSPRSSNLPCSAFLLRSARRKTIRRPKAEGKDIEIVGE